MEIRALSPIEHHLQELFIAVIAYLQTKAFYPKDKTRLAMTPQPEPLAILYSLRNLGTTYWPGGLANQPVLLLMEINKCVEAENQAAEVIANQAAQMAAQKENQNAQLGLPNQ